MWFMPSFGRPHALARMAKAPGVLPDVVMVLVNEDDPRRDDYVAAGREFWREGASTQWGFCTIPAGSRCADAHRFITTKWPNEPFYGLLCDDHWPVTPGWHQAMVDAAGDRYISGPAGESSFPLLRSAVGMGGGLVRAMGSIVPIPVRHNYEDNVWDTVAADFNLLKPLPEFIVEHRHWNLVRDGLNRDWSTTRDATYVRGSDSKIWDEDAQIFAAWLKSAERRELNARIAKFLHEGANGRN